MTNLQIFECINSHESTTSSRMIYDSSYNINIPQYAIVELSNEPLEMIYRYFHYNEKSNTFSTRTLIADERLYINYLMNYRPESLQKMLDNGMLYRNVRKLILKAQATVIRQVKIWAKSSNEIQLALKNHDRNKYNKLMMGLKETARNEVYNTLLYS